MDEAEERTTQGEEDEFDGFREDDMVVLDSVGEVDKVDHPRKEQDTEYDTDDDDDDDLSALTPSITISKVRKGILLGENVCKKEKRDSRDTLLKTHCTSSNRNTGNVCISVRKYSVCSKVEFEESKEGSNPPKLMSIPTRRPNRHDRKGVVPDLLSMPITRPKQYERRDVHGRNLRQEKTFGKVQTRRYTNLKRHLKEYGRRDRANVSRLNLQQEKTRACLLSLQREKTFGKAQTKRYTRKEKILSLLSMNVTPSDSSSLKLDPDPGAKLGNPHQTAGGFVDTVYYGYGGYNSYPNEAVSDVGGSYGQRDDNSKRQEGKSTRTKYGVSGT